MPWDRQARGRLEQQHGNEQRPRPGNLSALAGAVGYSETRKLVCHRRSRYKFRFLPLVVVSFPTRLIISVLVY
jgi:hypothetical protein